MILDLNKTKEIQKMCELSKKIDRHSYSEMLGFIESIVHNERKHKYFNEYQRNIIYAMAKQLLWLVDGIVIDSRMVDRYIKSYYGVEVAKYEKKQCEN